MEDKKTEQTSKDKKTLSLQPLDFDEALSDLLQIKPDESEKKKRGKKQVKDNDIE